MFVFRDLPTLIFEQFVKLVSEEHLRSSKPNFIRVLKLFLKSFMITEASKIQ